MAEPFEDIAASLDYPMVVVTVAANGERSGCLAGFTTQCSIDPPRYLVCVSKVNHTHALVTDATVLAVHVLRTTQRDLAELFGAETGDEIDKFEHCPWEPGPQQTPVLAGTDYFVGRIRGRFDAGDHTAVLVDVLPQASAHRAEEPQLGFQQIRDLDAGHDPDD